MHGLKDFDPRRTFAALLVAATNRSTPLEPTRQLTDPSSKGLVLSGQCRAVYALFAIDVLDDGRADRAAPYGADRNAETEMHFARERHKGEVYFLTRRDDRARAAAT